MRFSMLGSGSKGNATLIDTGSVRVMIDCGFNLLEMQTRAERFGFDLASLDGILVTHEHGDHLCGVARLANKYNLQVYLTQGTCLTWKKRDVKGKNIHIISPHEAFSIKDLSVQPIAVPHDAREPCQYAFTHKGKKVGVLSDLGAITPYIREQLSDCDALMLECNYDEHMLATGPYPKQLRERVGGPLGHLSNLQAASLAAVLDRSRLQHLALTHISEKNNTPQLAREAICNALQDDPTWCVCANQGQGLDWREVA